MFSIVHLFYKQTDRLSWEAGFLLKLPKRNNSETTGSFVIPYSTFVNVKRWTKLRLFLRISRSSPFIVVCCDQCNPEDSCARTKPPVEHEFLLVNLSIQNSFWSRTSQRWTRFLCTLDPSPIRQNPWSDRTKRGRGSLWFPSNKISSYRRESRITKHHFTIMMIIIMRWSSLW